MAHGELESIAYAKRKKEVTMIASILISAILGMTVWCVVSWYIFNFKVAKRQAQLENMIYIEPAGGGEDDQDVTLFNISAISAATNNFSLDNQIGQGGFGPVYQGQFPDGQNIAVKRLSQNSYQGIQEFKNEVTLIAQLQHRNLVKLLGCCIQGEERMLVYEYMPNKSVDQFIFDEARKILLPWEKRFDNEMNPKISDFGLARIFENEREETTRRVIGTHGYMSPEYVMDGHYSMKSDVYSFGVLAIEIISGQRNWGFHHPDHEHNLLGHAWALWKEGRALELMDPFLEESSNETKISRCIQVGLLCVQHRAEGRPTMSEVVSMLQDEHGILAEPGEPGFFRIRSFRWTVPASWDLNDSVNGLTVTTLTGRL
ncbi:unnamed protein product [Fraxinus pennsylvanica]|uniref:Protein kinase domain-containing protein n=1 Tax=Fraxinus pennsylvanica TaxID=56036 RepID=A0AAD1YSP5_9LAMI|nr:unnamed protein product [Fraxinus pennsylvanica]